jgi:hypothetical protein
VATPGDTGSADDLLREAFVTTSRYELMFSNMGWTLEEGGPV